MSMQNKLIIVGEGEWLDIAHDAATRLGRWEKIDLLVLERTGPYSFDIEVKLGEVSKDAEYFLALDGDHFGTIRESILSHMMQKGCSIASLIEEKLNKIFRMNVNCLIHPSAIVSELNSGWGYNIFIGPQVYISSRINLARTITIGRDSILRESVSIRKNVTLGNDVQVYAGLEIGEFSSFDCRIPLEIDISNGQKSCYRSNLFPRLVRFNKN